MTGQMTQCPPWCETEHPTYITHTRDIAEFTTGAGFVVNVHLSQLCRSDQAVVCITTHDSGGDVTFGSDLTPGTAEHLGVLIGGHPLGEALTVAAALLD